MVLLHFRRGTPAVRLGHTTAALGGLPCPTPTFRRRRTLHMLVARIQACCLLTMECRHARHRPTTALRSGIGLARTLLTAGVCPAACRPAALKHIAGPSGHLTPAMRRREAVRRLVRTRSAVHRLRARKVRVVWTGLADSVQKVMQAGRGHPRDLLATTGRNAPSTGATIEPGPDPATNLMLLVGTAETEMTVTSVVVHITRQRQGSAPVSALRLLATVDQAHLGQGTVLRHPHTRLRTSVVEAVPNNGSSSLQCRRRMASKQAVVWPHRTIKDGHRVVCHHRTIKDGRRACIRHAAGRARDHTVVQVPALDTMAKLEKGGGCSFIH